MVMKSLLLNKRLRTFKSVILSDIWSVQGNMTHCCLSLSIKTFSNALNRISRIKSSGHHGRADCENGLGKLSGCAIPAGCRRNDLPFARELSYCDENLPDFQQTYCRHRARARVPVPCRERLKRMISRIFIARGRIQRIAAAFTDGYYCEYINDREHRLPDSAMAEAMPDVAGSTADFDGYRAASTGRDCQMRTATLLQSDARQGCRVDSASWLSDINVMNGCAGRSCQLNRAGCCGSARPR